MSIHAYIISLKNSDDPRIVELSSLLRANGFDARFVNAVYGPGMDARSYFMSIQKYFQLTKRLLTPSELGCTLSHKKAYEEFLLTGDSSALILEDDAILDTAFFVGLKKIRDKNFDTKEFIHLGGQDGLEHIFKNVRGKLIHTDPKVFEVNSDDLGSLTRTVGYLISSESALKILNLLNDHPILIDDFSYIKKFAHIHNFYYTKLISHPVDLKLSTIESERLVKSMFITGSLSLGRRLINEIKKTIVHRSNKIKSKINYRAKIIDQEINHGG